MQKSVLALIMIIILVVSGCTPSIPSGTTNETGSSVSGNNTLESNYSYTWDMKNPGTQSTENLMMMQNGFKTTQKTTYTITQEDSNNLNQSYCINQFPIPVRADSLGIEIGKINKSDLQVGKELSFDVPYQGGGLGLQFSQEQLNKLNTDGWMIMEANHDLLERIINTTNYDPSSIEPSTPEWASYYDSVGGSSFSTQRYPYNTIYVSSDLLLHSYHKLFSNSLKAYEMTTARNLMSEVIDESLTHFSQLSKTNNKELKPYYEYLTAYWSIAKILLPSQQDIEQFIEDNRQLEYDNPENTLIQNGDLTDTSIKNIISQRTKEITKQYPTSYTTEVEQSINEILAGIENKKVDYLSESFSPQTDPNFVVIQDYTQFVPRSHYTDNSYLKTYFMSMKWMMRHKMYTRDEKSSIASLLLANNMPYNAQQKVEQLQGFIRKMIGADDDTNIQDIKQFLTTKKVSSDTDIINDYNSERTTQIANLRPQKIISTSYTTPTEGATSEQDAKIQTAGFIFFGEKFTPDAWMTDMFTAGLAEQESEIKPGVVSVYSLFEVLIGGQWADYAQQWFTTNKEKFNITDKQLNHYPILRNEIKEDINESISDTIYNKWINLLQTTSIIPKNPPAYMKGLSFIHKIANTILGSYTELKHDTLLYVKQAYAELGMGGDGDCAISIPVPALPVPKGYIEPQIDVIDKLLELSQETSTYFGDINTENFKLYRDYLEFIKTLALKQINNEIISDEEFEKLRLSSSVLTQILSPAPRYTTVGEQGMRSALIADIFTSGTYGPYYLANGRPLFMVVLIDDSNGKRAVIGPVYSTYEFYGTPFPSQAGRYTDNERRSHYDSLNNKEEIMSIPLKTILTP